MMIQSAVYDNTEYENDTIRVEMIKWEISILNKLKNTMELPLPLEPLGAIRKNRLQDDNTG